MKKVEELKDSKVLEASPEKTEEKDLRLTEVEMLRIENLQLKQDKVRMSSRELDLVERKLSSEISERLDVTIADYTVNLSKGILEKKGK